ncbi:MAG: hypothetical protein WC489_02905 [Patescibacteria group bacterium]
MSTIAAEKSAVQAQRVERQPQPATIVRDPLEGVMEGTNPAERYQNFTRRVLSRIWPSEEGGEYTDDFHRPTRFDRRFEEGAGQEDWISGYTQFSPAGRDPLNLTQEEFDVMVKKIGTSDYVRLRSVPPQVLDPHMNPMHVGGSCVIETWGERTMKEERAGIKAGLLPEKLLPETARQLVDLAPTITHASGALLGGYNRGVHLIETDMWAQRIAEDYGVPREEADQITQDAYRRIHDIVQRRSKLINPDSVLIPVNFDELGLPNAIEQWMESMGVPYDPSFRVAEVIHTYVGPQQLDLVKDAIQRQLNADGHTGPVRQAMEFLMQSTHHLRGKQIDHLRWGSMDLPKDVIMGLRETTEQEQQKMANDPAYARGIYIMTDVYRRHMEGNPTSVAAGFADLPTHGKQVQHETRLNFNGRPGTADETRTFLASVEKQFTDPARLHRKNVAEHLSYLQSYTADTKSAKQLMSAEMAKLQSELSPVKKARLSVEKTAGLVAQNEVTVADNNSAIDCYRQLQTGQLVKMTEQNQKHVKRLNDTAKKALEGVAKRVAEGNQNKYDLIDLERLPKVIEVLTAVETGQVPVITPHVATYLEESAQRLVKANTESTMQRRKQLQAAEDELERVKSLIPDAERKETRAAELKTGLATLTSPSYFPLSENPYVHHAMQFLWDPDFSVFLREAVRIQEERSAGSIKKDESNEQMRELMGRIYPKLESYINYLFGRTDYPIEMRYSQVLSN